MEEKLIDIEDVIAADQNGTLTEVFGTGTAVVVNDVDKIGYQGKDYKLDATQFKVAQQLKEKLVNIQKGIDTDTHHWIVNC